MGSQRKCWKFATQHWMFSLISVAVTRDDCVVWQIIFYLILVLRAMFLSINSLG